MTQKSELDLVGVGWPVCLLEFKRILTELKPGDILEILMQDPDAVDALVTIVECSGDHLLDKRKDPDRYWIQVRKGL